VDDLNTEMIREASYLMFPRKHKRYQAKKVNGKPEGSSNNGPSKERVPRGQKEKEKEEEKSKDFLRSIGVLGASSLIRRKRDVAKESEIEKEKEKEEEKKVEKKKRRRSRKRRSRSEGSLEKSQESEKPVTDRKEETELLSPEETAPRSPAIPPAGDAAV